MPRSILTRLEQTPGHPLRPVHYPPIVLTIVKGVVARIADVAISARLLPYIPALVAMGLGPNFNLEAGELVFREAIRSAIANSFPGLVVTELHVSLHYAPVKSASHQCIP